MATPLAYFAGRWSALERQLVEATLEALEGQLALPAAGMEAGCAWTCLCEEVEQEGVRLYIAGRLYLNIVLVGESVEVLCRELRTFARGADAPLRRRKDGLASRGPGVQEA